VHPFLKQLFQDGSKLAGLMIAYLYFFWWFLKSYVRFAFKLGAMAVLGLPTVLTLIEALERSAKLTLQFGPWFKYLDGLADRSPRLYAGISLAAGVYLIVHHVIETRKPAYEYHFVNRYLRFSEKVRGTESTLEVSDLLQLFFHCFEKSKIAHIAVRRMSEDGWLTVDRKEIYPKEEPNPTFFARLPRDKGVAGLVYKDRAVRYVPRLFFPFPRRHAALPSIYFPHAVKFDLKLKEEETELVMAKFDRDAFIVGIDSHGKEAELKFPFLSLLSVPLLDHDKNCVGVLNFDFERTDPLDRDDISMAAAIGRIVADEVSRRGSLPKTNAAPSVAQ
jgi:hypothetical protein